MRRFKTEPGTRRCAAFLEEAVLDQARAYGAAHGKSMSWAFNRAWLLTRKRFRALPTVPKEERIYPRDACKIRGAPFWLAPRQAEEMRAVAEAHDRPLSWVAIQAWVRAREAIRALPSRGPREPGPYAVLDVSLPGVAPELAAMAKEKGLSMSVLMVEAWRLARDRIRAMPGPGEPAPVASPPVHVPAATPARPFPVAPGLRRRAA